MVVNVHKADVEAWARPAPEHCRDAACLKPSREGIGFMQGQQQDCVDVASRKVLLEALKVGCRLRRE